ncbi:MAG: metal ABC transporter permease [Pseudanabaenaceae cyanobacterium]
MVLLWEPWQFAFMQRALVAVLLVAVLCGVAGSLLVVRRQALLGDAIAHSLLPGTALAFLANLPLSMGAFLAGLLAAFCMAVVPQRSPIKEDAAMGIVFSAFFAAGVILISAIQKERKIDLSHFLFGNLLATTPQDLLEMAIATAIGVGAIALFSKEILFYAFDPEGAAVAGLPVRFLEVGITVGITAAVTVGMKAVGVLLVLALSIAPGATAYLWMPRLRGMMVVAAGLAALSGILGLYGSYHLNIPSGPAIVLVSAGFFAIAWAWPRRT